MFLMKGIFTGLYLKSNLLMCRSFITLIWDVSSNETELDAVETYITVSEKKVSKLKHNYSCKQQHLQWQMANCQARMLFQLS